ncbi:MAG: histidinol-phosphate transaminase [Syntrophomonadaceae bacterium]|nr:histidinol-phosphate transaminase [Syntrophomonadaceae bacterium]
MQEFVKDRARQEIFKLKPYTPGKPIDEVKRELGLQNIIKLASNENPLGPAPRAIEAISNMLTEIHLYPDANCFNLKKALSSYHDVPTTGILIGNGSDELLKLLAETFLSSGDQIIVGQPTFSEYEFTALIMGAECIEVPLKDFTHDLPAMLDAITPKTKMIIICNPNNPTGTIVNRMQIKEFMSKLPPDILVVFDEAYYEYVESPEYSTGLEYLAQGRNVIVLRTFSKIYGLAALRIGYGLTSTEIAQAVERVMEPFNVNSPAQIGAVAALQDQEHVKRSRELNKQGKQYLYNEFKRMGLTYVPTEANFIFMDTGVDGREVFNRLLKLGVIVRTGDIFGLPTFIRVTVGTAEENQRFTTSLEKVLKDLK